MVSRDDTPAGELPRLAMKTPVLARYSVALSFTLLMTSCDETPKPPERVQRKLTTEELAREAEFMPWRSRAELRFQEEKLSEGEYFSVVEGRLREGENQYRAIRKKLDQAKYSLSVALWGLDAKELYGQELILLRNGFERHHAQVFTDSTGRALHQVVMLQPVGAKIASGADLRPPIPPQFAEEEVELPTIDPGATVAELGGDPSTPNPLPTEPEIDEGTPIAGPSSSTEGGAVGTAPEPEIFASSDDPVEPAGSGPAVDSVIGALEVPMEAEADLPDTPAVVRENETTGPDPQPNIPTEGEAVEAGDPEIDQATEPENEPAGAEEPKPVRAEIVEPAPALKTIAYKVVKGDNLSSIARRFGVSISEIKKASGLRSDMLRIGQTLKVPKQ